MSTPALGNNRPNPYHQDSVPNSVSCYINRLSNELLLKILSYIPQEFCPLGPNTGNLSHVARRWQYAYEPLLFRDLSFVQHKPSWRPNLRIKMFLKILEERPEVRRYPRRLEFNLREAERSEDDNIPGSRTLRSPAQDKEAYQLLIKILEACTRIRIIRTNVCIDSGLLYKTLKTLPHLEEIEARFDSPKLPLAKLNIPGLERLKLHYHADDWTRIVGNVTKGAKEPPSAPLHRDRNGPITQLQVYITEMLPPLYEQVFIWPKCLTHLSILISPQTTPRTYYDEQGLQRIVDIHRTTLEYIELALVYQDLPNFSTFPALKSLKLPA
jgi:hypothetical protein